MVKVLLDDIGDKLEQESVGYTDATTPQRACAVCLFFLSPGACEYVLGPIHPNGVCVLWQPEDNDASVEEELQI